MTGYNHITVLENEAVESLMVSSGKKYIDATLGGGGHAARILELGGKVLGIDQDEQALNHINMSMSAYIERDDLRIVKGNFRHIARIVELSGFGMVDGILLDIGVSSPQLDEAGRGFSFRRNERLDMRMDQTQEFSAYEAVNNYSRERLVDIFIRYGEEHNAKKIADAIIKERKDKEIGTTQELARLIERVPHASEATHPATKVFQALRIEVNDEINALKECIDQSVNLLNVNGRMVIISFHSLEDRVVKQAFRKFERNGQGTVLTKKPIVPSEVDTNINRRARSGKMRVIEKK